MRARLRNSERFGDPAFWRWTVKKCRSWEYANVSSTGALNCTACPLGGNCNALDTTQHTIVAQKNFWAPKTAGPRLKFFSCEEISKGCLGGNESNSLVSRCDAGNGFSDSILCAVCAPEKFVRDGSSCAKCGDRLLTLVGGLGATFLFCLFVYVEVSRAAAAEAGDRSSERH